MKSYLLGVARPRSQNDKATVVGRGPERPSQQFTAFERLLIVGSFRPIGLLLRKLHQELLSALKLHQELLSTPFKTLALGGSDAPVEVRLPFKTLDFGGVRKLFSEIELPFITCDL